MVLGTTERGRRSRQAALHYARERRRSLLSDARLFRVLELPMGGSADLSQTLTEKGSPITFGGVFDYTTGSSAVFLNTGALAFQSIPTGLRVTGAGGFKQDVVVSSGRRIRYNLAVRPGDAQVRLWLDSVCVVAAQFGTPPFEWHANGTLTYADAAGVDLVSPLSLYGLQRPRHFDAARVVDPGSDAQDDILFRAAVATFFASSAHPFVDNPDPTPD